jgi:hypothetical protein
MEIGEILAILFGLIATVLGIWLKAEVDKRLALQQQVAEGKRTAYSKFNELISNLMSSSQAAHPEKQADKVAERLADIRQDIWQYGSDEVVRAYAAWNQCTYQSALSSQGGPMPSLILMAEVIIKIREDLGLSKQGGVKPSDILRIFITDIDESYKMHERAAKAFKKSLATGLVKSTALESPESMGEKAG